MFTTTGFKYFFLPLAIVVSLFCLLTYALYHIMGSTSDLKKLYESGASAENEQMEKYILRRTRRMFIIWAVFIVAHRLGILYFGGVSGLGELVWCVDPWGFLPSLFIGSAYTQYAGVVWSNGDLAKFYTVASLIIDALIVYILWLWSRHAFASELLETEPSDRNGK